MTVWLRLSLGVFSLGSQSLLIDKLVVVLPEVHAGVLLEHVHRHLAEVVGDVGAAHAAGEAAPEDAGRRVAREGRQVGGGRGHAVVVLDVAPELQRVGEVAGADATPVDAGAHPPGVEGLGGRGDVLPVHFGVRVAENFRIHFLLS